MCGIAGVIGPVSSADIATVTKMIQIQAHRGPDGQGVRLLPGAVLAHRRLSILDLSDRASQPMSSQDGRHVLVYNGEIYNYLELRTELASGYEFLSDSDTEVLLAAWRRWGPDCLDRLEGMFAFCIHDTVSGAAFLARDRFGQKPLYVSEHEGRLFFASEIKGLLAGGVPAGPDMSVWGRYLTTASYDDTRETFFTGVSQLLPGECAWYRTGEELARNRHYRLADHYVPNGLGEAEAADRVRTVVTEACRIHMRSDVPVGMMLSGGLDSSAMVAALGLSVSLHAGVKCFSVDFGPDLTERPWIEATARRHHLPLDVSTFTPEDFLASIRPSMWHQEAPIGGLMNCAFDALLRKAKAQGYPVLLAGAGPDEIFGGYRNHHNLYLGLLLRSGAVDAEARLAEYASKWGVDIAAARYAAEQELDHPHTAIDGTVPVKLEALARGVVQVACAVAATPGSLGDPLRDSQLHYLQGSKIPRNMRMLDRLGMAHGIEIRSPFMDHRVVELGFSLSPDLYFLGGRGKGILRAAFQSAMDDGVRLATKRSIQAPQGTWLRREPMASYVQKLLDSESFASRGLFNVTRCKALFRRFLDGEFDNSFFVWQWINTEEWFRIFIDSDPVANPLYLATEASRQSLSAYD
jgi:asparagine synthase (glutamine-hydrolysing)